MNYNDFLLSRYKKMLGNEFNGFKKASQKKMPTYIRVNQLRTDEKELKKSLESRGFVLQKKMHNCFKIISGKHPIGATPEYLGGKYYIQDWTSLLPCLSLKPQPNEIIWDMTASPGGKTTHISELMHNNGVVVATDKKRMRSLFYNMMRMCCSNVMIYKKDARKMDFSPDKILLDAPCSGTGTMRKNPSRGKISEKDINYFSNMQKKLVEKAISSLDTGGVLVYATCSLEPEENEFIVEHALQNGMRIMETGFGNTGIVEFEGRRLDKQVKKTTRIWPFESSGFFFSKMVKK